MRGRRMVSRGNETAQSHRVDFQTCPHCGHHEGDHRKWNEYVITLVLHPRIQKAGNVALISECPACFETSWIHCDMDGFKWRREGKWPNAWVEKVEKLAAEVKLKALRDWGAGLCHRCKDLTSGTVDYHAWRYCKIGSGPVVVECESFQKFGARAPQPKGKEGP